MPIIPRNLWKDVEAIQKSLDGKKFPGKKITLDQRLAPLTNHPYSWRKPEDRAIPNPIARRYVNGLLDYDYLMHKIIEVVHKIKDGSVLTDQEEALLALANPKFKTKITEEIARVFIKISPEETDLLRAKLATFLATEANWQAGQGGGIVPGADTIRPR